jgi:hypothetical protein
MSECERELVWRGCAVSQRAARSGWPRVGWAVARFALSIAFAIARPDQGEA